MANITELVSAENRAAFAQQVRTMTDIMRPASMAIGQVQVIELDEEVKRLATLQNNMIELLSTLPGIDMQNLRTAIATNGQLTYDQNEARLRFSVSNPDNRTPVEITFHHTIDHRHFQLDIARDVALTSPGTDKLPTHGREQLTLDLDLDNGNLWGGNRLVITGEDPHNPLVDMPFDCGGLAFSDHHFNIPPGLKDSDIERLTGADKRSAMRQRKEYESKTTSERYETLALLQSLGIRTTPVSGMGFYHIEIPPLLKRLTQAVEIPAVTTQAA